jgi:hypothetical protein
MVSMPDLYGMPPQAKGDHKFQAYEEFLGYTLEIGRESTYSILRDLVRRMSDDGLDRAIKADQVSWAHYQTQEGYAYRCYVTLLAKAAEQEKLKRARQRPLHRVVGHKEE